MHAKAMSLAQGVSIIFIISVRINVYAVHTLISFRECGKRCDDAPKELVQWKKNRAIKIHCFFLSLSLPVCKVKWWHTNISHHKNTIDQCQSHFCVRIDKIPWKKLPFEWRNFSVILVEKNLNLDRNREF